MFDQTTLEASRSATSSPASAGGAMPRASQDGRTIENSGPGVAPASHLAQPASGKASTMPATFGRPSPISSASAILQSSLENRLRVRLTGSDLCEVIWKPWAAPWGQSLSRPRARVRTISETDSGSLPIAIWSTLRASDGEKGGPNMSFGAGGQPLPAQAAQSTWPTPVHSEARQGFQDRSRGKKGTQESLTTIAVKTTWATPAARPAGGTPEQFLQRKRNAVERGVSMGVALTELSLQVQPWTGPSEPTEKRGALNPEFVCWLMGFPTEWLNCAPLGTRSTRARQRNSSAPTSTPNVFD